MPPTAAVPTCQKRAQTCRGCTRYLAKVKLHFGGTSHLFDSLREHCWGGG